MMSISSINKNMSVMESVLGKSVVPRRKRKSKKQGHRILCLDGGGIKVSWWVEGWDHVGGVKGWGHGGR